MQDLTLKFGAFAVAALAATAARAEQFTLIHPEAASGADNAGIAVQADFPPGAGPFPTVVLASGQNYHMALPVLAQTARALVAEGFAVYRFNWTYMAATPAGKPSAELAAEIADMRRVVAAARAEPRVDEARIAVGGKSLGSVVAWRVFAADPALRSGLFLTPLCSRIDKDAAVPRSIAAEAYPGAPTETRASLFVAGEHDHLCAAPALHAFGATARGPVRIAVVGGDHGYENRHDAMTSAQADAERDRNIAGVARLAASFAADTLRAR